MANMVGTWRLDYRFVAAMIAGSIIVIWLVRLCLALGVHQTILADYFKSGSEMKVILNEPALAKNEIRSIKTSTLPSNDPRPRFDISIVEIGGYAWHNHRGVLYLRFFNNRLSSVVFYPDDFNHFLSEMARPLGLTGMGKKSNSPDMKIFVGSDTEGRSFITWQDIGLFSEEVHWLRRYS